MQLAGDEKKIRALFSELACEEAQVAPRFEKLWREASTQQASPQATPRVSKSLVFVAAILLVAVAVLFVAWSAYRLPAEQNAQTATPPTFTIRTSPQEPNPAIKAEVVQLRTQSHSTRRRCRARHQRSERGLEQRILQQAAMLASWKSPTESFVASPIRSGFESLPQLNESVKDLQSFLQKKESNQ
jgi:hypothetical protein